MKFKKRKRDRLKGFFKDILEELSASIICEVAGYIIMLIPRMMIRIVKNIW
ncbi:MULTISPECIES: hypothetical protein [unclassified Peribacillus]|uniref:hypothetical protein n=1 Tax=unclassified Peribacillus TaxID=2675266 RepID=UPI00380A54DE